MVPLNGQSTGRRPDSNLAGKNAILFKCHECLIDSSVAAVFLTATKVRGSHGNLSAT